MAGSNYVAYNIAQVRSDSEKLQARNNIGAAALASLAPAFSTSTSYNEGAVVTYNGALYIFDSAHAAGPWTGADAHEVSVADIMPVVNSLNLNDYAFQDLIGDVVYNNGFNRRNTSDEYVRYYPNLSILTINLIVKKTSSIVSPDWTNLFTLTNNQFWFSDYNQDSSKVPVGVLGVGGGATFTTGVNQNGGTTNNIVLQGFLSEGYCAYKDILVQSTNYGCYFNKAFAVVKK